ncbi:hypothetical protein [Companilactobacillus formosensis]|uniref:hypothetical protein n=1 Tax=Companilactobacillus formosensis TaxID=1617889 RepID=UPI000E65915D|nr:hypothetical protein [Companilactobacillus formosensis]
MEKIISVEHLVKNYDNHKAVNDLNFSVEKGSFTAFLYTSIANSFQDYPLYTEFVKPYFKTADSYRKFLISLFTIQLIILPILALFLLVNYVKYFKKKPDF